MGNSIKSRKGSATVEAAILVPIIILSIAIVIYIGLILCERCSMQAAADNASEAGSVAWRHAAADLETGKLHAGDFNIDSLYWRVSDEQKALKSEKARESAYSYGYAQHVVKPESREASAEMSDYVVYKSLTVGLEQNYHVPIPGFFSIFGVGNKLELKARSLSAINEPAELIRNTDFVIDLERELEKKYPSVKNIGEKVRNSIAQVKEKVSSFTD